MQTLKEYISDDTDDLVKFQIFSLLFTAFGKDFANWQTLKNKITITKLYDIIFEMLNIDYIYKLTNNIYSEAHVIPPNFTKFISKNTSPNDDIKLYFFDKLKIENKEKYKNITVKNQDIEEYVYFKNCPNLLHKIKSLEISPSPVKKEMEDFYWEYFIWRKKNDPILESAPNTLTINSENFTKYKIFLKSNHGWSRKQLETYLLTVMIPEFLKQSNLIINTNHKVYTECIHFPFSNFKFASIINSYISGKRLNEDVLKIINKTFDDPILKDKNKKIQLHQIYNKLEKTNYKKLIENDIYKRFYSIIVCLKYKQLLTRFYLEEKIEKIKIKYSKTNYRFKWQKMCAELTDTTHIQTLRELALIENIENASMMTKREICKAFAEKLEKLIEEKQKAIDNKECTNEISFLTGEDVKDIPTEFFLMYSHNNKIYCDDIRAMKTQIDTNKGMHPGFRQPLENTTIVNINKKYDNLLKSTISMLDIDDIEQDKSALSPESLLQSQMTNLVLKTNENGYINNQQLFINSNQEQYDEFLEKLKTNYLLNEKEIIYVKNFKTLVSQKIKLVELLALKIDNDPNKEGNLSEIATNLVNTYNEIFKIN